MISNKTKKNHTYQDLNDLQVPNTLDQQLTRQFVDTYEHITTKANVKVLIDCYEQFRRQLKGLIDKMSSCLQDNLRKNLN